MAVQVLLADWMLVSYVFILKIMVIAHAWAGLSMLHQQIGETRIQDYRGIDGA